jgi:hypothetical protein
MKKTILFIYDFVMRTLSVYVLYILLLTLSDLKTNDYKFWIILFVVPISSGISTGYYLKEKTK